MIQFPNKNMSVVESQIVERLISDILAAGLTVSVNDGEDYPLRYSTDMKAIMDALASTDGDELVLHEPKNAQGLRMRVGWISLIWGNDASVISDYTVNSEPWVRRANALAEHLDNVARGFSKPFAPNTKARFWVLARNGVARVTLRRGQSLSYVEGGPDDEGYSYTKRTWLFDGEEIYHRWETDARDCDGRISRTGVVACPIAKLKDGYNCPDYNVLFPNWREISASQRDYAAEAAGY